MFCSLSKPISHWWSKRQVNKIWSVIKKVKRTFVKFGQKSGTDFHHSEEV